MVSPGSARPPGKLYLNFRYPVQYEMLLHFNTFQRQSTSPAYQPFVNRTVSPVMQMTNPVESSSPVSNTMKKGQNI